MISASWHWAALPEFSFCSSSSIRAASATLFPMYCWNRALGHSLKIWSPCHRIGGVARSHYCPARPAFTLQHFEQRLTQLQSALHSEVADPDACEHALGCPDMATVAENLERAARAVQSPQQHMEQALSPWVTFLVIPLFALSNAAIDFHAIELGKTLSPPCHDGRDARAGVGKVHWNLLLQLACYKDKNCQVTSRRRLVASSGSGMAGRYRFHHVSFHQPTGL